MVTSHDSSEQYVFNRGGGPSDHYTNTVLEMSSITVRFSIVAARSMNVRATVYSVSVNGYVSRVSSCHKHPEIKLDERSGLMSPVDPRP